MSAGDTYGRSPMEPLMGALLERDKVWTEAVKSVMRRDRWEREYDPEALCIIWSP